MFLIDDFLRSLYSSFQSQNSVFGQRSVVIFLVIYILGFLPAVFFLVYPTIDATDECIAQPFLKIDAAALWYKGIQLWQSMFTALFLIAVAVLGHSPTSCFLFFCAPTTNILLWWLVIQNEALQVTTKDENENVMACWQDLLLQIGIFWMLTALALLGSILD